VSQDRPLDPGIQGIDSATLRWAVDAARFVRSPVFPGVAFAVALVVAGIGGLVLSGWATHGQYYVALQVPYLISGGFGALGLVVTGAFLASLLGNRRDNAMADREYDAVLKQITELARDRIEDRARAAAGGSR
jgi:hypothetical protein